MKTLIKYAFLATVFYFFINWLADNPNALDNFRNQMNDFVDICIQRTKHFLGENVHESG